MINCWVCSLSRHEVKWYTCTVQLLWASESLPCKEGCQWRSGVSLFSGENSRNRLLLNLPCCFQMSCELNAHGGGGPGSSRSSSGIQIGSAWFQRRINLRPQHRGVHLVTEEVLRQIPELSQFSVGLAHFQSKSWKLISSITDLSPTNPACSTLLFHFSSPHISQFGPEWELGSRCQVRKLFPPCSNFPN